MQSLGGGQNHNKGLRMGDKEGRWEGEAGKY